MSTLTIRRRLRPLRLGFLVRPTDRAALARAIEINTCVWGGRHNVILPAVGTSVLADGRRFAPAAYLAGYVKRFEPDFVVDMTKGRCALPSGVAVVDEKEILDRERGGLVERGMSMLYAYQHQYEQAYRFKRRAQDRVVLPPFNDGGRDLLLKAVFGAFPRELPQFARSFRFVFEPNEDAITPQNYAEAGVSLTPCRLTTASTAIFRRAPCGPALFLVRANNPADVIDYWNLRALGWQLAPVPVDWQDELVPESVRFLRARVDWYAERTHLRVSTMLLAARSVKARELQTFIEALRRAGAPSVRYRPTFPRLWDPLEAEYDVERCRLETAEDEIERDIEKARASVSLRPLAPPFSTDTEPLFNGGVRWANLLQFSAYEDIPTVATAVPPSVDASRLLSTRPGEVAITSEGITFYSRERGREILRVPTPADVLKGWATASGLKAQPSAAGRIAMSVVRAVGGLHRVRLLKRRELVHKLDEMSHGVIPIHEESAPPLRSDRRQKPLTRPRVESFEKILALFKKLHRHEDVARRHLKQLVDAGAFRIGLQIPCAECEQWNWYPLEKVDNELRCDRCLVTYSFPASSPPKGGHWAYRTQGPFSIENYGHGAYAVVLAISALLESWHGSDATWVASTKLVPEDGRELETDFIIWRRHWLTENVSTMFGECKCFTRFTTRDLENATLLTKRFPGAYHVFATLRDKLSPQEVRQLRAFARAGRRPISGGAWRTPVIVLTGNELFSESGMPHCWSTGDARARRAASNCKAWDPLSLAQATQLLYLDLEPDLSHEAAERTVQGFTPSAAGPGAE